MASFKEIYLPTIEYPAPDLPPSVLPAETLRQLYHTANNQLTPEERDCLRKEFDLRLADLLPPSGPDYFILTEPIIPGLSRATWSFFSCLNRLLEEAAPGHPDLIVDTDSLGLVEG